MPPEPAAPHADPGPRADREQVPPGLRHLRNAALALGLLAFALTRRQDGIAISESARVLLVGAGLALLPYALALAVFEDDGRPPPLPLPTRVIALGWLSLALFGIAEGLSYEDEDSGWQLLALPLALTATAAAAWFALAPEARSFAPRWFVAAACVVLAGAGWQAVFAIF